jgi:hypothetical protein
MIFPYNSLENYLLLGDNHLTSWKPLSFLPATRCHIGFPAVTCYYDSMRLTKTQQNALDLARTPGGLTRDATHHNVIAALESKGLVVYRTETRRYHATILGRALRYGVWYFRGPALARLQSLANALGATTLAKLARVSLRTLQRAQTPPGVRWDPYARIYTYIMGRRP